jgi:hypothetical protein
MRGAVLGFVAGVVLTGSGALWLLEKEADSPLVLPRKDYSGQQLPNGQSWVFFSGAITGEEVGYPNNFFRAHCSEADRECQIITMRQIGRNQIGEPDIETWQVVRWTPDLIVVSSQQNTPPLGCSRVILNILPRTEEVQYIREPINHTSPECYNMDMRLFRWSINETLWWKQMDERQS